MPENGITDFFAYISAVFDVAVKTWRRGDGKFEVSVSDINDKIKATIKGGPNWRLHKEKEGGDE